MRQRATDFDAGDWLADPALAMCSAAARGIWMDAVCSMRQLDRCGQLSGTPEQLCRACRCTAEEMLRAIDELRSTGAATVEECHGIVTLTHRRMKREYDARKTSSGRQKRKRARASADASRVCGEDVTDVSRPCHADVTELSRQKATPCHADVTPDERLGQRIIKECNFNGSSDMAFDPQIEAPGVTAVSRDCHADVTPPSRLGKEEREAPPSFPPSLSPETPFPSPLLSPQEKEEISFGSRGGRDFPKEDSPCSDPLSADQVKAMPAESYRQFLDRQFAPFRHAKRLDELREVYGAIDVIQQIGEAKRWLLTCPPAKRKRAIGRFVETWLRTAQHRAAFRREEPPGPASGLKAGNYEKGKDYYESPD